MEHRPQRCLDCLVRDAALCAALRDDELESLSAIGRRREFDGGKVISWSGDPNTVFANVVSGTLKVTASTEDGREQIVGILYPGDFLGEPFADEVRLTATAVSPVDLCTFARSDFEHALGDHPRMERMLLQRTMDSLQAARERMLSLARMSARERVAGFLLEVVDRTGGGTGDRAEIELPLARGEMADYLGLTIETVSRQITRLKQLDVIEVRKGERSCTVLSVDRLRGLASA